MNLVAPLLCPNYEDYLGYNQRSCTIKHWPAMWDGERQAEHGIWEERLKLKKMSFFCSLSPPHSTKPKHPEIKNLVERALVCLAEDNNWEVVCTIENRQIYRII